MEKEAEKRRLVGLSRVLWEQVLVPWVIGPAASDEVDRPSLTGDALACLLRTAEAAFPLVPACCRAALAAHARCPWAGPVRRRALADAASAPSGRCVAWIIAEGRRRSRGHGHGEEEEEEEDEGDEGDRERRGARERVAVLSGLCYGGHLERARVFVESDGEAWVDDDGTEPRYLWAAKGRARDGMAGGNTIAAIEFSIIIPKVSGTPALQPSIWTDGSVALQCDVRNTALGDEFWSKGGIFQLMRKTCACGQLEVLKWILSRFFRFDKLNDWVLRALLQEAADTGNLTILKWLVSSFDVIDMANAMSVSLSSSFQPRNPADIKDLVESFPSWDYSISRVDLAGAVGWIKFANQDEVIDVCKWLMNRFPLEKTDFTTKEYPKVIRWAYSDCTDTERLKDVWNDTCSSIGDIDLAKWFIEEKGIIPEPMNFISASRTERDNLAFLQWLYTRVTLSS
ncbi:hypothetical protein Pelo_17033 [Pelomyxa schiedti]|nr:hypothetical protein Pelo_17033 [Pelomyxa schiedti]